MCGFFSKNKSDVHSALLEVRDVGGAALQDYRETLEVQKLLAELNEGLKTGRIRDNPRLRRDIQAFTTMLAKDTRDAHNLLQRMIEELKEGLSHEVEPEDDQKAA